MATNVVFEKEVIFHEFDFEIWDPTTSTESNFCVFFFHYSLATLTIDWAQIFTGLLFYAFVEIHQVKRLIFDNYW